MTFELIFIFLLKIVGYLLLGGFAIFLIVAILEMLISFYYENFWRK
jgi:hypothetical protein